MRWNSVSTAVMLLCVASLAACATGGMTSGQVAVQSPNASVQVAINSHDRDVIHDYYRAHQPGKKKMPPGLAKRQGHLPPGLAKRDRLPPGLQREPLPYDLERQLTPLPANYVRVRIGTDIVLLDQRTNVVIDIARDIAL